MEHAQPLIVIVGETGSGKSTVALTVAELCNGEIISADSWSVYRGFDVGTAKPTPKERQRVTHYGLDVAEAADGFNAVIFKSLAVEAIAGITARGKVPILVGGTGLYIDSVIFDYGFLPATDPVLRSKLDVLSLDDLVRKAYEMKLDTANIDLRNKRRVIRLIENDGRRPTKRALRPHTLILGLQTEREALEGRIVNRVDAMLAAGLEQEVRQLSEKYGWTTEPLKGVGYWQWKAYFEGTQTYAETRTKIIRATMDLAKRQRTWFKRNNSIHWLITDDKSQEAVELVTSFLDNLD